MEYCGLCRKTFESLDGVIRHVKRMHGITISRHADVVRHFFCDYCGDGFTTKHNVLTHMKRRHKVMENNDIRPCAIGFKGTRCPICECGVRDYIELEHHLKNIHDISLEKEVHVFYSESDFDKWRHFIERKEKFNFVKGSIKKYLTYMCHCSGYVRRQGKLSKRLGKTSVKINKTCPVRLRAEHDNGLIRVTYWKTHLGHKPSVETMSLIKEEREEIAAIIQAGITPNQILQTLREQLPSIKELRRIHLLSKQDIRNIMAEFNLPSPGELTDQVKPEMQKVEELFVQEADEASMECQSTEVDLQEPEDGLPGLIGTDTLELNQKEEVDYILDYCKTLYEAIDTNDPMMERIKEKAEEFCLFLEKCQDSVIPSM